MTFNFGPWRDWASQSAVDDLVQLICTGSSVSSVAADEPLAEAIGRLKRRVSVLDFGCGVGRNAINIAMKFPDTSVTGYDSESMIARAEEYCLAKYGHPVNEIPNLRLATDWGGLREERYDCVYATLVFQHLQHQDAIEYLEDIKRMTGTMLVYGRRYNDHGGSTWELFERCGMIPSNASEIAYSVHGEAEEHTPLARYEIK
jgi:2-polyprenyl-3-methyl-5-hydroxy-6-metoxy-1,4-benzoquinol methylase